MRVLLNAAAAGAVVFLVLRAIMDFTTYGVAAQAEFLRPPAGGFSGAQALELAGWATASYWIAVVVALIVAVVTPLVKWSATWPGPEAGPPLAPPTAQPAAARAQPAAAPRAQAPVLAASRSGAGEDAEPVWRPQGNSYAQDLKSRYGAARIRPSRKIAEDRPKRMVAPKPSMAARRG